METRRKRFMVFLCGLLLLLAGSIQSTALGADPQPAAPRKFTARAEFSSPGSGTRTIQVGIVVDHVIHQEEVRDYAASLEQGGQRALLAAMRNRASGRLMLGVVPYTLNLITAKPSGDGFRYVVVTGRPIKIHERDTGQPSLEYPFAVLVFDVDESGRGEGELYQTAALRIDDYGKLEVENFHGKPGRLIDIRTQD